MRRPPQPIPRAECPHCHRLVLSHLFAGCPVLEARRREQERADRERARLFGIERKGGVR